MKRISVDSSNIKSIGYEIEKGLLEIEFNSGSIYQYYAVPESEYNGLLNASSKGGYFNDYIKHTYRYSKV